MCVLFEGAVGVYSISPMQFTFLPVQVMLIRGVMGCPVDCDCDYLQRCGVRYKTK